jgi:hypothetical protein
MRSPALDTLLRPIERTRRILWIVCFIATLDFIHAASWTEWRSHPIPFPSTEAQTAAIVALAVGEVALFWLVPRLLLPDRRLRTIISQGPAAESLARNWRGRIGQRRLEAAMALSTSERRQYLAARASTFPFISQLAFAVSVTIFGFMIVTSGRPWLLILPFAIVTIVLLLTLSPKVDSSLERAPRLFQQ